MKILYDHQIFSAQNYGGISRYFYEIMNYFFTKQLIEFDVSLKYSNNHYIKNVLFSSHCPFFENIKFKGKVRLLNILNKIKSIAAIKRQNFDIFHPTYYNPYFLDYIGNKPFVLTIHDMIHEIFPEMFSAKDNTSKWKKLLAKKAIRIIAVSENTKRDIVRFYGIDAQKIKVIYHGNSLHITQKSETEPMKLPDRYLLYVGNRGGYKNFNVFIESVTPLLHKDETLNIVCAGGERFTEYEKTLFMKMKIDKQIHNYSNISDEQLGYLYKNAIAFVFPSLYEGFGIPILEAFSCGCPLIVSNTSSLPEVAGDAAVYFDPTNEASIRESISKILNNEEIRNNLRIKGFERVKKFSWQKTAEETLQIYNSVL